MILLLSLSEIQTRKFRVLDNKHELKDGRLMTVVADHSDLCLTNWKGKLTAMINKCPHQGGGRIDGGSRFRRQQRH